MALTLSFILNGIISGLAAVIVMTVAMMLAQKIRLAPPMDMPLKIGRMFIKPQNPPSPSKNPQPDPTDGKARKVGMLTHFLTGIILGAVFVIILNFFSPYSTLLNGLIYGAAIWLVVGLTFTPMTGGGILGTKMGMRAPLASLINHAIYGLILGWLIGLIPLS